MKWAPLRVLLALALALLPAARAEAGERSSSLLLTVAAPAAEAERLEAVMRELLARLEMHVELRRVERISVAEMRQPLAPELRYFARVWIAFGSSGSARLYLEHGESDRLLVREVAGDTGNPELLREELGHILQTAVEGLKAGEALGAPRSDALKQVAADDAAVAADDEPAREPVLVARAKPPERSRVRFGPRYELVWLGDGGLFEDGPGAVLGLALPVDFELLGYYRRPLKIEGVPVGARLQTLSLRGLVTIPVWRREGAELRLGGGVGADFVRVSPIAEPERNVELESSRWLTLAMGRLEVCYAHRVFRFMDLELRLGLDADLSDTRYVFQQSSGEHNVFEPWRVRPLLSLGVAVP